VLVIPALGKLRQEELKLKASLDYIARPCLKSKKLVLKNNKSTKGWGCDSSVKIACIASLSS
jgi:hypothetical protein